MLSNIVSSYLKMVDIVYAIQSHKDLLLQHEFTILYHSIHEHGFSAQNIFGGRLIQQKFFPVFAKIGYNDFLTQQFFSQILIVHYECLLIVCLASKGFEEHNGQLSR